MNKKTSKTYIKQLLKRHGSYEAVAKLLGVTPRWVRYLEKDVPPGESLRRFIKVVLGNS